MAGMLRIVGLNKNENANREFVLLQNQGSMRISLKGHLVVSEDALLTGALSHSAYAFSDEVTIAPGLFVILFSGDGEPRWARTKDGAMVYHAYMGRSHPVWHHCGATMHVVSVQHTYTERAEPSLLLK